MLTRRQGLTAVAVLGPIGFLGACSSGAEPEPPASSSLPATVATAVAAQEQELVAFYAAVIAAYPELAEPLQAISAQHALHASTLDPTSGPSTAPPSSDLPETAEEALAALVSAEKRATRQRIDACVEATDAGLARTLAFIAASEGSHASELRDLRA